MQGFDATLGAAALAATVATGAVVGAVVGAAVGAVVAAVLEQAEAMSAATEINATALRLINIEILTSL